MIHKYRLFFIVFGMLFMVNGMHGFSQTKNKLSVLRDSLKYWQSSIEKSGDDSTRSIHTMHFKRVLRAFLTSEGSFTYPLDSVRLLKRVVEEKQQFLIITWSIAKSNGGYDFFGFLQFNPKGKRAKPLVELTDTGNGVPDPDHQQMGADHWLGAIYYRIITTEVNGKSCYTLLGWRGVNTELTTKVIEPISIQETGEVRFGNPLFKGYPDEKCTRVLFRFSSSAVMFLDYDEQFLPEKKNWNASKRQFEVETIKKFMIVADELVPRDPILEGQFEYYIPSSESFDGFLFEGGYWHYYKNIDARNR